GAAGALQGGVRGTNQRPRARRAAVGDGALPIRGARAVSPRAPSGKSSRASRASRSSRTPPSSGDNRFKSSSGNIHASSMYRPPEWLGRGGSAIWTAQTPVQPQHRSGLRRRLSIALVVAALGPVAAVSSVASVLIFSSVEQGIQFEAERGLQVARGLFLQQVQDVAAGA